MEGNGDVARATPAIAARRLPAASWPGAMAGAFLVALGRPRWWVLALAAFLLRGGIVLVLLPILVPPTVASLSSLAAPTIAAVAFGSPPPGMIEAYAIGGALVAAWLVVAVLVGAWLDLALVAAPARDEDLELARRELGEPIWRAAAVRLLAHVATVALAAYTIVRFVVETYSELLAPGDQAIPLVWRIVARVPDAVILLLGSWLVGEAVGALAVRRVAAGDTAGRALARALRGLARPSGVATLLLTNAGVATMVLPLWLASARTWDQLRALLVDDGSAPLVAVSLLLLIAAWGLGLALLAAALAWRSAAWTAEAHRSPIGVAGVPEPASTGDAAGEPVAA